MKLILSHIIKKKIKGFSIIELVVSIGLISLISFGLLNLINSNSLLIHKLGKQYDGNLELEFGIKYMINEIDSADLIIEGNLPDMSSSDSLGLFIVNINEASKTEKYSITTYSFSNKRLMRLNHKGAVIPKRINGREFDGRNVLVGGLDSFTANYDSENKFLEIKLKNDLSEIYKAHYIRGVFYEE